MDPINPILYGLGRALAPRRLPSAAVNGIRYREEDEDTVAVEMGMARCGSRTSLPPSSSSSAEDAAPALISGGGGRRVARRWIRPPLRSHRRRRPPLRRILGGKKGDGSKIPRRERVAGHRIHAGTAAVARSVRGLVTARWIPCLHCCYVQEAAAAVAARRRRLSLPPPSGGEERRREEGREE
uniref:Uncharacterized protein n=1 Tax=Oryza sativa subsp. japonica TaxID=39947 RepID=Q6ENZ8_ORYSJ|nr:hypothetical protein [Oryza sativa Japonica Group]